MTIKINSLELENVKKIKAVKLEPTTDGLTIIGGKNKQGKTSVLNSIQWLLGGNKFKPSDAKREGSALDPTLKVTLSNGLVVERKGKNSDLTVTDPSGQKAGQKLLDSFISELALDLPKFMEMNNKDKARTLLQIIGVEEELNRLDLEENKLYQTRLATGQNRDKKKHSAEEMKYYPEVEQDSPLSVMDLIGQQQAILAKNGENQQQRNRLSSLKQEQENDKANVMRIIDQIKELEEKRQVLIDRMQERERNISIGEKSVEALVDESTAELEASIKNVEELNSKIETNRRRKEAFEEAEELKEKYDELSGEIESIRQAKFDLLNGANLPLPELSIEDGELTYKGFKWDNLSGTEQLQVATAIVRELNKEAGFVLLDKLEAFDMDELSRFGQWAEQEGLQIIATRVSSGDECTIIITDGYSEEVEEKEQSWSNVDWK